MRQKNDAFVEILDATEQDGQYFGCVRLERDGEQKCFQFGVSRAGYMALKRALQTRPFDQMPSVRHHYFFVAPVQRIDDERAVMSIRVVQGKNHKHLDMQAPTDPVANLKWFAELGDWDKADKLAVTDPRL